MTKNVLFIHSLFRSGSTYLFHAFRRSGNDNYCYQEPFNEYIFNALEDPEKLLELKGSGEMQRLLKHPKIGRPYFAEFHDTFEHWKSVITPEISYDDYFGLYAPAKTNEYLKALINAPEQKNVVIQTCRTGPRIGNIKSRLKGHHVYLWRNPWDQWWSCKANEYFEIILQVIASAKVIPPVIKKICDANAIAILPNHSFEQQLQHFQQRWVTPKNSYMLFFALWCLNMLEATEEADVMLSVDDLSQNKIYKKTIADNFSAMGFPGNDFSDCNITQSVFTAKEAEFFRPIEEKTYQFLSETGVSKTDIDILRKTCEASTQVLQKIKSLPDTERERIKTIQSLRGVVLRAQEGREREGNKGNTHISILNGHVSELKKNEEKTASELSALQLNNDNLLKTVELIKLEKDNESTLTKTRQESVRQETLAQAIRYQSLLDDQMNNVTRLSEAVEMMSKQNETIFSNFHETQFKLEEERKHYAFLQSEHEKILDFTDHQERNLTALNENHQSEREKLSRSIEALTASHQEIQTSKERAEAELLAQLTAKSMHLDAVLTSSSWRIMKPFRSIFDLKDRARPFVKRVLLKLLALVRSSRVLKVFAGILIALIPGMKAKTKAFTSANPKPMRSVSVPRWNLQLDGKSKKQWVSALKKGKPT